MFCQLSLPLVYFRRRGCDSCSSRCMKDPGSHFTVVLRNKVCRPFFFFEKKKEHGKKTRQYHKNLTINYTITPVSPLTVHSHLLRHTPSTWTRTGRGTVQVWTPTSLFSRRILSKTPRPPTSVVLRQWSCVNSGWTKINVLCLSFCFNIL